MKRLFWLGLGVAVGAYATRRATEAAHSMTPAGMGANIADGLRELGAGLGAFGAEVRAGMTEREQELSELVERRTGAALPTVSDAFAEPQTPQRSVSQRSVSQRPAAQRTGAQQATGAAPARARRAGA